MSTTVRSHSHGTFTSRTEVSSMTAMIENSGAAKRLLYRDNVTASTNTRPSQVYHHW